MPETPAHSPRPAWLAAIQLASGCAVGAAGAALLGAADVPDWMAGLGGALAGVTCARALDSLANPTAKRAVQPMISAALDPAPSELPPLLLAALDAAPAPVMIVLPGGRLMALNRSARERFGLASPGGRIEAAVRNPDLINAVNASLLDGQIRQVQFATPVPVERFERAIVAPFETAGRRLVLLTIADETEQRVSERMRADFLANASHELRTPLASIAGFIETLRGPARDDAEARDRFLKIMDDQASRMSRLIADLTSLSRIELLERVAPTGTVSLTTLVGDVVEALPQRDLIKLSIPDEAVDVIGDADQITQVLTNLLDNAAKYGVGRPVSVEVSGGLTRENAVLAAGRQWPDALRLPLSSPSHEPGRSYAVLRVADEGPGIAREELPRLTERFYRVETTSRGVPGTGLGLAIVKHIINRHRGGVMVETRPGRGTAFSVYMPQPTGI
jgi:two-component system, OmpR family, phosphate regulon sensor histidine kinase PhoR